jgi:predicted DNA binding protein
VPGLERSLGFSGFNVLRVGGVTPSAYTSLARRVLAPDQDELLALAASMGYYNTPKTVTLGQIAQVVGLSVSPVHKRLKAAEERLVALQVEDAPGARPRRVRRELARATPDTPWEAGLRVKSSKLGPASVLAQHPEARALIVPQGESAERDAFALVMLLVAPPEVQARVRAQLAERPEVEQVHTVAQERDCVFFRFRVRGSEGYGLGAWGQALGADVPLRSLVVERDEATLRFLVLKPRTLDDLDARLKACAKVAGWQEHELIWLHAVRDRSPAPTPEPLTARQSEVLRVATALGYYRTPRSCTLEGVANTLGVSANAIHKNLVLAESKLIGTYLASSL